MNKESYFSRELAYLPAHAVAVMDTIPREHYFERLSSCAEAAMLCDSPDAETQALGYQTLDELQAGTSDDPEMMLIYERILNFMDTADSEAGYQLINKFIELAYWQNPDFLETVETSNGRSLGWKQVFARLVAGSKEAVRKLAEEPEITMEAAEPYNGGYPEIDPAAQELDSHAAWAERRLSVIPGINLKSLGRVLGLRGSIEENASAALEYQNKFIRLTVKHLSGEYIGDDRIGQSILNSETPMTIETARQIIPNIDELIERRQKSQARIGEFLSKRQLKEPSNV